MFKVVILTTYNPSASDLNNIERLSGFSDLIIIIDNSPLHITGCLQFGEDFLEKCFLLSNFNCGGLSGAFNQARTLLRRLRDLNIIPSQASVTLLDQDTHIDATVLGALSSTIKDVKQPAAVGAVFSDRSLVSQEGGLIELSCLPSSTTTLTIDTFLSAPNYDIQFPIDLADFVWCWKAAASYNMKFFVDTRVEIHQHLGIGTFSFFGRKLTYPSPVRHMYQCEAALRLWSVKCAPLKSKIRFTCALLIKLFIYPFCLPNGATRCKYMIRGVFRYLWC
jgi:hypothetical protein